MEKNFLEFETRENFNKTPAEQRDIFRPKLIYNYINWRFKNSQCTEKRKEVRIKESFDSSQPISKETPNLLLLR